MRTKICDTISFGETRESLALCRSVRPVGSLVLLNLFLFFINKNNNEVTPGKRTSVDRGPSNVCYLPVSSDRSLVFPLGNSA